MNCKWCRLYNDILEFANNSNGFLYLWFNFSRMFFKNFFLIKLYSSMFLRISLIKWMIWKVKGAWDAIDLLQEQNNNFMSLHRTRTLKGKGSELRRFMLAFYCIFFRKTPLLMFHRSYQNAGKVLITEKSPLWRRWHRN